MSKIKLGFIGAGFMGQMAHLQNYAQINDCEIYAIAETKKKQAERVAQIYKIPNIYEDYRKMLEDPAIDAVVAAQPFGNHVNFVPDVLKAGKHLMTEKPLCIYAENGRKLAELAREAGKIHMVGYHKRSDLAAEYALGVITEWKKSGELGKMKYIRITMPPGDWVGGCRDAYMSDEENFTFKQESIPQGIDEKTHRMYESFVNYYIHQVNLMRYFMGEDYKLTFADRSGILMAVESQSGIPGLLEMEPYHTTDAWQEQALVCFEKGWVRIDYPAPLASQQAGRVTIFNNAGEQGITSSPQLPNVHAMLNQARNFVKAVRGEKSAPCVSAEAVKDLDIAMNYIRMFQNCPL